MILDFLQAGHVAIFVLITKKVNGTFIVKKIIEKIVLYK